MKTIEVPKVTKPSWSDGAFTIAFVYSNKGNFILKGYSGDVRHYLKDYKYFANFTYYGCNGMRSYWSCSNDGVYIKKPKLRSQPEGGQGYKYHFQVIKYDRNSNKKEFKLKRLPKKYIAEIFESIKN